MIHTGAFLDLNGVSHALVPIVASTVVHVFDRHIFVFIAVASLFFSVG